MVGFSSFVSIGSMLDVDWGDLISYLGNDPRTNAIVIYMESIGECAVVPFGGARSFADQADHRDQGRSHRSRRQSGRLAYRFADRQRRSAGCGLPARGRAAREQHRRCLLHDRGVGEAAATTREPALHPDQCRRSGRVGDGCADPRRWCAGGTLGRHDEGVRRIVAAALEPQQSGRHPGRRGARALCKVAGDRRQRPEHRRHAHRDDAARHDESHADRRDS